MNIALVSSKGGHLGQMKIIFTEQVLGDKKTILVTEDKNELAVKEHNFLKKYRTYFFRKDYLGFNPIRYFITTIQLMRIFRGEDIDLVFTNGAQISIPAVIAARLLGIRSVFIDTVIRVKTPNWSARACYFVANVFLVQHPEMAKKYGSKARFAGGIV